MYRMGQISWRRKTSEHSTTSCYACGESPDMRRRQQSFGDRGSAEHGVRRIRDCRQCNQRLSRRQWRTFCLWRKWSVCSPWGCQLGTSSVRGRKYLYSICTSWLLRGLDQAQNGDRRSAGSSFIFNGIKTLSHSGIYRLILIERWNFLSSENSYMPLQNFRWGEFNF